MGHISEENKLQGYSYYFQSGVNEAVEISNEWGIYVSKIEGLNSLPSIKKVFEQDWKDEQGVEVYIPDDMLFNDRDIVITFCMFNQTKAQIKDKFYSMLEYIAEAGVFNYFDTYRQTGARMYYSKQKMAEDRYRDQGSYIEFDLTFSAPNGISYGIQNTSDTGVSLSLKKGTADIYFSDGDAYLNQSEPLDKDIDEGFIVICPTSYRNVIVTQYTPKTIGIANKTLGIANKTLGIKR